MAKEVKARLRLQIPGGAATPAPPVGAALGQQGINIMEFCKQFNARTADKKGQTVPVLINVYKDKTFDFTVKTPPTSELIKKKINLTTGSSKPNVNKVGRISRKDIQEIAKIKMPDLNAADLEQAEKIIAGSARSMGIEVVE
ncbi:50S ribosomal protein L11 [Candidatus Babela massiliensis]|uniref:Large ribosomal subunit protein uL11 n=1 Tax=Candidatus Babela massiliensis TaxID=673862 RepID=V6DG65_9BACT|nr:50S ribosomal protein L11 [Candidatus Babela massiliensis]CDK30544.1 ribosomal protein L11 [Candidatus Babela massiliensis]